ncbi:hypothetical protein ACF3M2_14020 [Tissierella carlieri]|uniref:hypothetical protein n=1 Tax=Tissierella TaxID=41273 RepID=UPI003063745C
MLDKIFSSLPIIFTLVGCLLFLFSLKTLIKRKRINKRKSIYDRILKKIDKNTTLKEIKDNISYKISVINSDSEDKNDIRAIKLILTHILLSLGIALYMATVTDVWYIIILTFCFTIGVPLFAFSLYFEYKIRKRSMQLPLATEELSLGFGNTNTLVGGIREGLPHMKKEIKRELERFSYSLEQDKPENSTNKFIGRTPDRWIKILGVIFLSYIKKGGDLSSSLDYFSDNISYSILYREKTKNRMFLPKVIVLFIYILIPVSMYFNTKMFPVAKVIYFTDIEAMKLIFFSIASNTVALIAIFLLQRT